MIRHLIVLFLFIAFEINYLHSQSNNSSGDENVNVFTNGENRLTGVSFKKENSLIEGNTYLFPKWVERGNLLTKTEKKYALLNVNYNVLNDSFEIKISKDSIFRLDSNYISQIDLSGKTFRKYYTKYVKDHFVEVLFEKNNILLLKKYNIKVIKGSTNPLNGERTPDKYHVYNEYYFLRDKIPIKIKLNKKDILSLFKEKTNSIKSYAKENGLSYKKEKDIINILEFSSSF